MKFIYAIAVVKHIMLRHLDGGVRNVSMMFAVNVFPLHPRIEGRTRSWKLILALKIINLNLYSTIATMGSMNAICVLKLVSQIMEDGAALSVVLAFVQCVNLVRKQKDN